MTTNAQEQRVMTALPPGPRHLPYIGNLLSLRQDPLNFLRRLERMYGNMATIYVGKNPAVLLFRPEYVRYILVEHPRDFTNQGVLQDANGSDGGFASEGLLTIDGNSHRQQRHAVQPAFHKKRVEGYNTIIQQYTQDLLKTWQSGDTVDLSRDMQALTLRIISKCLFSVDLSSQLAQIGEAFNGIIGSSTSMAEDLLNIHIDNPVTGYGKRMAAVRQLDMLIYTLIAQRRGDEHESDDVLSMLLSANSGDELEPQLSDKQIHDHLVTFLAAGHETTALSLVWSFYLLAQHPEVRTRLQNELRTVFGDREMNAEELGKVPLLDWVLNESMRLYPPAWLQMRFSTKDIELDGVILPAGTMLIMSQWITHRLPDLWQDADTFQPERWNPANKQSIPPGAYFPFGGGPRTCIGMPLAQQEARIILATVLQNYTPEPPVDYTPGFQPLITLRPKNPLRVTLLSASPETSPDRSPRFMSGDRAMGRRKRDRKGCLPFILRLLFSRRRRK